MEDLAASGVDVPALRDRPEVGPDLAYILGLFQLISHSRPPAFDGLAGVRITDIEAVYRLCEVTILPADEFVEWMLYLDGVMLGWYAEKERARRRAKNGHG